MCSEAKQLQRMIMVDLVDNWHPRWREVLDAVEHVGQRDALSIDEDGWLSARHNLLVAFIDDSVAGHLSFRVQPVNGENGQVLFDGGRAVVEARVESVGVQPGFSAEEIRQMLRGAAERRAQALRCRRLVEGDA